MRRPSRRHGRLPSVDPHRPAVRLNMIESLDGAAAVNGRTAGLGGTADHTVAAILRSLADVILVGAGTLRTEAYGPASLDSEARTRRQSAGLAVDLGVALRSLAERGVSNVLAEGGPRVSAQLAAGGLLDELCLTLAPQLVAGAAARILRPRTR